MILRIAALAIFTLLFALGCGSGARAAEPFDAWLEGVKSEAAQKGISQRTIARALDGIEPIPRVIALDRKQPEGTMSFAQYKKNTVGRARVQKGRELYRKHRDLLEKISAQYGVQPQYIVALWGIETSYGGNTGGFKVVDSLATLAHDGRRSDFFREELFLALRILDEGHIAPDRMKGSWAGAMGQNQFMPSSFFKHAVDGDGDGKRDIWGSLPDVFASTANYLAQNGWQGDARWGRHIELPRNFPQEAEGRAVKKSLREWDKMGVRLPGGGRLPDTAGFEASVIAPDGLNGPAYLTYQNFETILTWNKSRYFGLSVGLLADSIAAG